MGGGPYHQDAAGAQEVDVDTVAGQVLVEGARLGAQLDGSGATRLEADEDEARVLVVVLLLVAAPVAAGPVVAPIAPDAGGAAGVLGSGG